MHQLRLTLYNMNFTYIVCVHIDANQFYIKAIYIPVYIFHDILYMLCLFRQL